MATYKEITWSEPKEPEKDNELPENDVIPTYPIDLSKSSALKVKGDPDVCKGGIIGNNMSEIQENYKNESGMVQYECENAIFLLNTEVGKQEYSAPEMEIEVEVEEEIEKLKELSLGEMVDLILDDDGKTEEETNSELGQIVAQLTSRYGNNHTYISEILKAFSVEKKDPFGVPDPKIKQNLAQIDRLLRENIRNGYEKHTEGLLKIDADERLPSDIVYEKSSRILNNSDLIYTYKELFERARKELTGPQIDMLIDNLSKPHPASPQELYDDAKDW